MKKRTIVVAVVLFGLVAMILGTMTPIPPRKIMPARAREDLTGSSNPAAVTMDSDKMILTTFTSTQANNDVWHLNALTDLDNGFVTTQDDQFMLAGCPLYFAGVNFWQGMNLAVNGPSGNRTRLGEELDHLQQLGVTNLRVMAASEGPNTEPYRMVPALMISPGVYNASVLDGLDYLLAQIRTRGMRAVMVLNNYWHWSGGMAQYVSWYENSSIPYPGDWGVFMAYSAKFYGYAQCQTWYRDHIQTIINRTNPYTGQKYRDDPAIFSWELANEPRSYPDAWIDDTAAYIKSLDSNHLVTTGSEGNLPWHIEDFIETHNGPDIDYTTIHIWPQNWGWYNPANPSTYATAEANARDYFQEHATEASSLGKPLVLEEFGLARDWEPLHDIYDPDSPTTYRDLFYAAMFEEIFNSASVGGPAAGDNIWVWSGQARPGDQWVGDPPHEIPGWYSVYDADGSTLAVISSHAEDMALVSACSRTLTANFTYSPLSTYVNVSFTFDGSTSTPTWNGTHLFSITAYNWDLGNGDNATATNPTLHYAYDKVGVYNVTLTIINEQGANHSATTKLTIKFLGDANGDGFIGGFDATMVGIHWWSPSAGNPNYSPLADFNGDGFVGGQDATILGIYWWTSVPKP